MNKEKTIKIVGLSIFGIVTIVIIALLPIWGDDMTQATESFDNSVPKMSRDESFSINDITSFDEDDFKVKEDEFSENINADDLLDRVSAAKGESGEDIINDNIVNDSLLQAMVDAQEDQDRIEELRRFELKEAREEKRLEHIRYLKKKRKAEKQERRKRELSRVVEVEAAIYTSKLVKPNARAELILTKDCEIFGKKYKRGTYILAYMQIQDSRIFLDIENIQGQSLNIRVYDSYDFREGLYHERVEALWEEYKNEQAKKGNNELSNSISNTTSSTLVGNVIQDFGDFFRKKKVRKKDKILLVGNHSVILKITRKENP